ncbi:cysteine desulfurase-like protein [Lentzea tibetensis]|uniref:Cysteine desulfurase-like protein n=1 Tax=Lentzea tibetensis TaxID=2591470 RepID=A0A563EKA9_9PSEU|nr:cysteine desulfurase-like protein [Lentzea tibetensis]TWP46520.1 cysteine desulfurase-like protein [Lentzea tibetensis]
MDYDVAAVRSHFPALNEGASHFDGPGGSQTPDVVAEAVTSALTAAIANRGSITRAEQRAEEIVATARRTMAGFLNAETVVFGRSMTQLTYDFARTLARNWTAQDEVIVTRLDHDANIRPWVQAAEAVGATVRWAAFDKDTAELHTKDITDLLTDRTRLVAVTGASNLLGTKPDIEAITRKAHEANALVYVDGVHLTPHAKVDVEAMGADFYACSPYKFLGPHLGVLAAKAETLEQLHPDKLLPSTNEVPERFELGTLPYELLAGTTAAVDFLESLGMDALEAHENALRDRLEAGLREIPDIKIYGSPERDRTPTVLFTAEGEEPQEVYRRLAAHNVNAPASHFYAIEASRWLGLGDKGGVRAGIAPYTNESDVDRLLEALAQR